MKFWATRYRIGYYAPDDPEPGSKSGPLARHSIRSGPGPSTDIWWYGTVSMCFDMAGPTEAIGGCPRTTPIEVAHDEGLLRTPSEGTRSRLGSGTVSRITWASGSRANLGNGWSQTIEGNTLRLTQDRRVPKCAHRRQRHYGIDCASTWNI